MPTPDFIAAAMKDQEKPGMALEVRYPWETKAILSPTVEIVTTIDTYYVRTPRFIYMRQEFTRHADPSIDASRVYSPGYTTTSLYNRNTREYRELRKNEGGAPPQGRVAYDDRYAMLGYMTSVESVVAFFANTSLYSMVEKGSIVGKKAIDGCDCWGIRYAIHPEVQDYVIWVDPKIGSCPRRIEIVWKDVVRHSRTMRKYEEIAKGVWFPMEVVDAYFDKGGKELRSTTVTDIEARLVPLEDEAKLKVDFPPGTFIERDNEKEKQTP